MIKLAFGFEVPESDERFTPKRASRLEGFYDIPGSKNLYYSSGHGYPLTTIRAHDGRAFLNGWSDEAMSAPEEKLRRASIPRPVTITIS